MYRYVIALLFFAPLAIANRLSINEEDLLSPDLGLMEDAQLGRLMQPDVINVALSGDGARGNYDIDRLEPIRNHKKKKPRRNNLTRVKNHEARHDTRDNDVAPADSINNSTKAVATETIRWKPESQQKVDNCRLGQNQPSWNETDCISCQCRSNDVLCQKMECPKLECKDQINVEGECCPKCPEKLCETSDGRRFKHNKEWHMDDCTFCKCKKGKVECSVEDCQVPRCKQPIKVPGRCCPVCLDASCDAANGTKITSEEVWQEGSCTHCYCYGGETECGEERCPYINCTGRHIPVGQCCDKCNEGVVDCQVSEWGSWSDCPVQECGGGMAKRYRSVLVPPKNGGDFCPHMSEARMCDRLPCDVLPVCPVTEWSSWSYCTVTCGEGRRMRTRERAKAAGAPMTSLIDCTETHFEETKQCELGSCSAKVDSDHKEVAVHDDICFQVMWSDWSPCSMSMCGSGMQRRNQVLINQSHPRGHLCRLLEQVRICQCDQSMMGGKVVRCQVSPWSPWTACSKTCGSGAVRTKKRTVIQQPSGGAQCPKLIVSKPCRTKACSSRVESFSHRNICFTVDGKLKVNGEEWSEGACVSCVCDRTQVRCQNTGC